MADTGKIVNKTELAEIFGVTHKTLTTWQSQGLPIMVTGAKGNQNLYDTKVVFAWRMELEIARRFGTADHATEALNKDYEQARLAKAQADGKEIENQIKRGELVPIEFVTTVLAKVAEQITAVLDSIPQQLKRLVPKLTASDIDVVKREIAKTQNAAARIDVHIDELAEAYIRDKGGLKAVGETRASDAVGVDG